MNLKLRLVYDPIKRKKVSVALTDKEYAFLMQLDGKINGLPAIDTEFLEKHINEAREEDGVLVWN